MNYLNTLIENLKQCKQKGSCLAKYYEARLDEDSNKVILIQEYCKMTNLFYNIETYGYQDEQKVKIIVFQILKALQKLAEAGYYHGKLTLNNIMVSSNDKVKVTDYAIYNMNHPLAFKDGMSIDIFNLGIIILKLLGKVRLNEKIDMYNYDKRTLRENYKNDSISADLKNFLDILLVKRNTDLDLIELHSFMQITDDDIKSLSKFSKDTDDHSKVTDSVKCVMTFQTQSGKIIFVLF